MNPKLVGCLAGSMIVGGAGAIGALSAGWGLLAALGIYSLAGSVSLVPIAAFAFRDTQPKSRPTQAKPAAAFS